MIISLIIISCNTCLLNYTNYNDLTLFFLSYLKEWEVLLLSKLDWDMSAVIAFDFVEHIIQRIRKMQFHAIVGLITPETLRKHSETLITMCSAQDVFSSFSPSLIAAACVMTTLRPLLEASSNQTAGDDGTPTTTSSLLPRDTPSPSSCSSTGSTPTKAAKTSTTKVPDVNQVLEIVEKFTVADKVSYLFRCLTYYRVTL